MRGAPGTSARGAPGTSARGAPVASYKFRDSIFFSESILTNYILEDSCVKLYP